MRAGISSAGDDAERSSDNAHIMEMTGWEAKEEVQGASMRRYRVRRQGKRTG